MFRNASCQAFYTLCGKVSIETVGHPFHFKPVETGWDSFHFTTVETVRHSLRVIPVEHTFQANTLKGEGR